MPMNPEWLPVLAMLLAGIFAVVAAMNAFFNHDPRRGATMLAIGSVTIALAFWIGQQGSIHWTPARGLTPAGQAPRPSPDDDSDSTSMSLLVGQVTLRAPGQKHYTLAVDGHPFLDLELDRHGLWVSAEPAGSRRFIVRRNNLRYPTMPLEEPDSHTLLLEERGENILRVRYSNPRSIEITGAFHPEGRKDTFVVGAKGGIRWEGGGVPPAALIDLRYFGKGTIDFERSGRVRVLHR
jgi:hypothetical protein